MSKSTVHNVRRRHPEKLFFTVCIMGSRTSFLSYFGSGLKNSLELFYAKLKSVKKKKKIQTNLETNHYK